MVRFSLPEVAPWAQVNDEGEANGLLVDLVERLEEVSGLTLSYQIRPYPRVQRELERGEADFTLMFGFPEMENELQPSGRVISLRTLVLGTRDTPDIDSLQDLNGKKVGYIRGAYYSERHLSHELLEQVPVRDFSHGMELLEHGRIAAMVCDEVAVLSQYEPGKAPPLRILMELDRAEGHLLFSRNSHKREALKKLSKALESLKTQGELDRIFGERLDDQILLETSR